MARDTSGLGRPPRRGSATCGTTNTVPGRRFSAELLASSLPKFLELETPKDSGGCKETENVPPELAE